MDKAEKQKVEWTSKTYVIEAWIHLTYILITAESTNSNNILRYKTKFF